MVISIQQRFGQLYSARQGTHIAISAAFFARIASFLSRFLIFCWPYWTNNKYLVGPIRPANDPCMQGLLAQPDIYCWLNRDSKRLKTLTEKQ